MEEIVLNGWLPDPPKPEDWKFRDIKPRLRKLAKTGDHMIQVFTPVSHQGQLHSCAANVTADALEILMGLGGTVVQLSRLFIYFNARNYHGAIDKDKGTYLRMAFESLKRLGVCPESMWDYVEANVFLRPPLAAYKEANANKVMGFYRIDSRGEERLDDIETAIRANHPVAFGTQVGTEFSNYKGETEYIFRLPEAFEGRHAMLWCGVRKRNGRREFWTRNSWGSGWGLGGYAWMDQSYVTSSETRDIWVPTRMPRLI